MIEYATTFAIYSKIHMDTNGFWLVSADDLKGFRQVSGRFPNVLDGFLLQEYGEKAGFLWVCNPPNILLISDMRKTRQRLHSPAHAIAVFVFGSSSVGFRIRLAYLS